MTVKEAFDKCYRLLVGNNQITDDDIKETIDLFRNKLDKDVDVSDLKDMLLMKLNVTIDMSKALVDKSHYTPWLDDFKAEHRDWPFWDRYKIYFFGVFYA